MNPTQTLNDFLNQYVLLLLVLIGFFSVWYYKPSVLQTFSLMGLIGYVYFYCFRPSPQLRLVFLSITIFSLIFIPIAANVILNNDVSVSDVPVLLNAGTEYASQGKNPYSETYYNTVVSESAISNAGFWKRMGSDYLAFIHFPYLGGVFALTLPYEWVFPHESYAGLLFILLLVIFSLIITFYRPSAEFFLPIIFLNPLINFSLNTLNSVDFLFLFLILFGVISWQRGYPLLAGIFWGLMMSIKTYNLVFLPFLGWWIFKQREFRVGWGAFATILLANGFFLMWDAYSYLDDVFFSLIGGRSTDLTIWTDFSGFMPLLVKMGVISSHDAGLSIILVLASFFTIFWFFIQQKNSSFVHVWVYSAIAGFFLLFFSKHMPPNYLTLPFFLLVGAMLLQFNPLSTRNSHDTAKLPA